MSDPRAHLLRTALPALEEIGAQLDATATEEEKQLAGTEILRDLLDATTTLSSPEANVINSQHVVA